MKSLFLSFILFGRWSVEGSVGVVRGPVRSGGPWTGGQCFRVTRTKVAYHNLAVHSSVNPIARTSNKSCED